MVCSVCRTRGSIGYCMECHELLCEVCSTSCAQCGQILCAEHVRRMRDGRVLCKRCAGIVEAQENGATGSPGVEPEALSFEAMKRELRESPEPDTAADAPSEAAQAAQGERGEGASFQSLISELGEAAAQEGPLAPPNRPAGGRRRTVHMGNENDFRVLTASSPKPAPMWVNGLLLGIVSCIMLAPLVRETVFSDVRRLVSYVVLVVSGGTLLWCGFGLARRGPAKERWLCLIGLFMGLLAAAVALIVRIRTKG